MINILFIPDFLVKTYGNISEVSRILGCERSTVKKYARDFSGQSHVVLIRDDSYHLMIKHKTKRKNLIHEH